MFVKFIETNYIMCEFVCKFETILNVSNKIKIILMLIIYNAFIK